MTKLLCLLISFLFLNYSDFQRDIVDSDYAITCARTIDGVNATLTIDKVNFSGPVRITAVHTYDVNIYDPILLGYDVYVYRFDVTKQAGVGELVYAETWIDFTRDDTGFVNTGSDFTGAVIYRTTLTPDTGIDLEAGRYWIGVRAILGLHENGDIGGKVCQIMDEKTNGGIKWCLFVDESGIPQRQWVTVFGRRLNFPFEIAYEAGAP